MSTSAYKTTTVPLSALFPDPINVRRHGQGAEPEFIASIRTHGVLDPLLVRPNDKGYGVFCGGKRLAALNALLAEGAIKSAHAVPVTLMVVDDATARELSLTENFIRKTMHPVDEYRAFAQLHTDKEKPLDVDAIAARFGLPRKRVEQSLALGNLAPVILDAWLAGMLSNEAVQAFTLAHDHKTQERIYKKLSKGGGGVYADDVKDDLKAGLNDAGRYVSFVGVEAYEARGGKITRDLFGTDHIVSDAKLAKAMAEEKLEAEAARLQAEGWGFVIPFPQNQYQYGKVDPKLDASSAEQAELDRLTAIAENDALEHPAQSEADRAYDKLFAAIQARSYTTEQKAKSGCFVEIGRDGALRVEYGRVTPSEKKKVAAQEAKASPKAKAKKAEEAAISGALAQRLSVTLTSAAARSVVAEPDLALTFALAGLWSSGYGGSCVMLKNEGMHGRAMDRDMDFVDAYAKAAKLSAKERMTRLAEQVGAAFEFGGCTPDAKKHEDVATICQLIDPERLNKALRAGFDAEDYFNGVPKALCLAAITEAVNADEARKVSGRPKGEIAKFAIANVPKTGWLPVELRTANYDGPVTKKAKAAPKGKAKPKKSK